MFTGIVSRKRHVVDPAPRLGVLAMSFETDFEEGESLSVSGVCLTVVKASKTDVEATLSATVMEGHEPVPNRTWDQWRLEFDLSPETMDRTSLSALQPDDEVNLERPATLSTLLGGHLVQGHVDGVGTVTEVHDAAAGKDMRIELPD